MVKGGSVRGEGGGHVWQRGGVHGKGGSEEGHAW